MLGPVPDRFVALPGGRVLSVEVKRPGKRALGRTRKTAKLPRADARSGREIDRVEPQPAISAQAANETKIPKMDPWRRVTL